MLHGGERGVATHMVNSCSSLGDHAVQLVCDAGSTTIAFSAPEHTFCGNRTMHLDVDVVSSTLQLPADGVGDKLLILWEASPGEQPELVMMSKDEFWSSIKAVYLASDELMRILEEQLGGQQLEAQLEGQGEVVPRQQQLSSAHAAMLNTKTATATQQRACSNAQHKDGYIEQVRIV